MTATACGEDRQVEAIELGASDGVPPELLELMERVRRLPLELRRDLEPIVAEAQDHARFRGRVLAIARDALVRLRLDLELARFDRDVSHRERRELGLPG